MNIINNIVRRLLGSKALSMVIFSNLDAFTVD